MSARWIPYSPSCEPAPDWISLIQQRDLDSLSWLQNRTILVLGDSVDRNGLHHMAEMMGLPRYCVPYDDFSKKGVVPEGWDERGIPWVVEIPWLNTYFTNGFMYGLVRFLSSFLPLLDFFSLTFDAEYRTTRTTSDSNPTGTLPVKLRSALTSSSKSTPLSSPSLPPSSRSTLAVRSPPFPFHSPRFTETHPSSRAVWDLAFFGRQDRITHLSTEIPFTHKRVEWWQKRMRDLVRHVNGTWEGVPIWLRKLHRVGPVGGASCALPFPFASPPSRSFFSLRIDAELVLISPFSYRRLASHRLRRPRHARKVFQLFHRHSHPYDSGNAGAGREGRWDPGV